MTKMKIKCDECGGIVGEQEVPFSLHGELLGNFPAEVCKQCGEKVFDEETADRIDKLAQEKGLWNLSSRTKVVQVGSSLGLTFSKRLSDFIKMQKGREVIIYPDTKQRFIIEFLE